MENKRKETFYRGYHVPDKLEPGKHLSIERRIEYDPWRVNLTNLPELVKLSQNELEAKREDSAKKEAEHLSGMQSAIQGWEDQAVQTMLLDRAIEYAITPEVVNTANKWKQLEDGSWEISNRTYVMRFKIWEDPKKDGAFLVSWAVGMNIPPRPGTEKYYYGGDPRIAYQDRKHYDTMEAAQRYVQGRFDLYAGLFTEMCPPIPDNFKHHFHINGCLLPGYTVAPPERTEPDPKAVNALLDLLDADEEAAPPPAPQQKEASPQAVWDRHRKQRPRNHQKKQAPER